MFPMRGDRYELAIFRTGLLFGFGIGAIVGFLLATLIAVWCIQAYLPDAVREALSTL